MSREVGRYRGRTGGREEGIGGRREVSREGGGIERGQEEGRKV